VYLSCASRDRLFEMIGKSRKSPPRLPFFEPLPSNAKSKKTELDGNVARWKTRTAGSWDTCVG
jgi:hypothetical protein